MWKSPRPKGGRKSHQVGIAQQRWGFEFLHCFECTIPGAPAQPGLIGEPRKEIASEVFGDAWGVAPASRMRLI
ncbi:MAG: hypothetical protein WBC04_04605 [Candidatus Acidiferrales bacterium]